MRFFEITLTDRKGRKVARLFAQVRRKAEAVAQARLALADYPNAARYHLLED